MIRADAEVPAEPDPLFAFFTSVAGYKVIDPACNNHDDKPLRQWSERCACAQRPAPARSARAIAWGEPARSQRCMPLRLPPTPAGATAACAAVAPVTAAATRAGRPQTCALHTCFTYADTGYRKLQQSRSACPFRTLLLGSNVSTRPCCAREDVAYAS